MSDGTANEWEATLEDLGERLSALCLDGTDVFFENVGGQVLDPVLAHLARGARMVLCSSIPRYNAVQQGFENASKTLQRQHTGANSGKQLLAVWFGAILTRAASPR